MANTTTPQFDPTCIKLFQAGDWSGVDPNKVFTIDTTATYAMIDLGLYNEAVAGLTAPQKAVVDSYRYTPTAGDYANRGFLQWAGGSPATVYFKVTGLPATQAILLQSALSKRYK